jgi:hypothetical protein
MGKYEDDPAWDDVVPIPQDDGEGALAQIAYSDEYAEGTFSSCWTPTLLSEQGIRTRSSQPLILIKSQILTSSQPWATSVP